MMVRLLTTTLLALAGVHLPAQEPKLIGYPQKDALSPFRNPTDVYAPPDEAYRLLRIMQTLADAQGAPKQFGTDGRETISGKGAHVREGAVVRPRVERRDDRVGRVQLKSVSEKYLLRDGGTEFQ